MSRTIYTIDEETAMFAFAKDEPFSLVFSEHEDAATIMVDVRKARCIQFFNNGTMDLDFDKFSVCIEHKPYVDQYGFEIFKASKIIEGGEA